MLCAFLNIRSEEARRQSPAEARSGRRSFSSNFETANAAPVRGSSFSGGIEPAKWTSWWIRADAWNCLKRSGTELPDVGDTVNLDFVRNVVGKSRVAAGAVVCRTQNAFPLAKGFRALPVTELR